MKYLLQFTPNGSVPPVEDRVPTSKAAAAYIAELQNKGTLEAAYAFVAGGGIGIMEVASHEELWEIVFAYPLFTSFQWHVEPLVDAAHVTMRGIEILKQEAVE